MSYYLRNNQNVLVAELPDSIAFQLIDNFKGKTQLKNFVSGDKACYVFAVAGSMIVSNTVKLYVLNDYYLVKNI